ncbi:MAG: sulfate transporter [Actinomycetia bacterium]|nr:sulfate transporter [Actinomycetes bacterium]
MSGAAQTVGIRSVPVRSKDRTGAALRHLGLRGAALIYLGAMVLVPIAAIVTKGFGDGLTSFRTALAVPGAWPAIRLTLLTSAVATLINAVMGTLLAWVLVRYRFPGRRVLSAVVDLPMAIPTLVTGLMLLTLYGPNSPIGQALEGVGLRVAFTSIGILLALCVVTLPLVVRQVQPVLLELDPAEEEAASTLGAGAWFSFRKVVFPAIRPAIVGGGLLTFARCIGEFGSVVLISGNLAGKTLTAPVFIFQLANQFRPAEAASIATLMFAISFVLVLVTARLLARRAEA